MKKKNNSLLKFIPAFLICLSFNYCIAQVSNPVKIAMPHPSKAGIMNKLYANYNAKDETSKWVCCDKQILKTFELKENTPFLSKILYSDTLNDGGHKVWYVLLALNPFEDYTCHACAPVLSFYCFTKIKGLWNLNYNTTTGQFGVYGTAPSFTIKKVGKNNVGFLFQAYNMGQGIEEGGYVLYCFYKNKFQGILDIYDTSGSNSGQCDPDVPNSCYSFESKIQFLNAGKEFNDVKIFKKGTIFKQDKLVKID
jgi:hypothetical protein